MNKLVVTSKDNQSSLSPGEIGRLILTFEKLMEICCEIARVEADPRFASGL
jgi:hypothetical protein